MTENSYKTSGVQYHQYLTNAYDFFNENLFAVVFKNEFVDYDNRLMSDGRQPKNKVKLEDVIVTLTHKKSAGGYYRPSGYLDQSISKVVPELAICYNGLYGTTKDTLAILVHEMCHVMQFELETQPKVIAYHNKLWANYMRKCGLEPYNTKYPHLDTGYTLSHKIQENWIFDQLAGKFIAANGEFPLAQNNVLTPIKQKVNSRPKMQCPNCKLSLTVPASIVNDVTITCKVCNTKLEEHMKDNE